MLISSPRAAFSCSVPCRAAAEFPARSFFSSQSSKLSARRGFLAMAAPASLLPAPRPAASLSPSARLPCIARSLLQARRQSSPAAPRALLPELAQIRQFLLCSSPSPSSTSNCFPMAFSVSPCSLLPQARCVPPSSRILPRPVPSAAGQARRPSPSPSQLRSFPWRFPHATLPARNSPVVQLTAPWIPGHRACFLSPSALLTFLTRAPSRA
uniref:Uncharacterized protein n=1 Tax=Zea mays TaxID=4577 RepID=A0A804N4U7_MAIZE